MTRTLILTNTIAALVGAAGVAMLARPSAARRLLGIGESDQATYALRIVGAMLFAAALFAGGFATAYMLAVAA